MPAHEAAQNVAWFAIAVVVGIAFVLWRDCKKEKKQDKPSDYIFDHTKTIIKFNPPRSLEIADQLTKKEKL